MVYYIYFTLVCLNLPREPIFVKTKDVNVAIYCQEQLLTFKNELIYFKKEKMFCRVQDVKLEIESGVTK